MGIPRFASWIFNNRARKLTISHIPQNVASLSFDVNSIIHGCAQIVYNYGEWTNEQRKIAISEMTDAQLELELFKLITDTFLRIVQRVNPKNCLVLAVDGVAPLAKIQQQRCRRYRASTTAHEMRFEPNCITPGTDFMFRLDEYLQTWIQNHLQDIRAKVLYSNHMVPGEGEQKIFDYVRNYEISGYGSHIIYGLDADLIILSLISRLKGIYLLREKSLEQNVYERLIHIDEVRDYLHYRMQMNTAIDDFAILTFFLGNDFVPTSPMFSGDMYDTIEYLLETYDKLGLPLTYPKDGKINMRNFQKLIWCMMKDENQRLKHVYEYPPKLGFRTLELSVKSHIEYGKMKINLDKKEFQKNWYTKVFSPPIDKIDMAFQLPNSIYLALFEPNEQKIQMLVRDYIHSFSWTYLYYKKGTAIVSPNFCYSCGYAPLMEDVYHFFPSNIPPIFKKDIKEDYSFTVLHQLLAVLPPKSISIIPKELHSFYSIDSPIADLFPSKVDIDTDGKDMERLGVVRMCPVEPRRLLGLNFDICEEKKKQYHPQSGLCFEYKCPEIYQDEKKPIIEKDKEYNLDRPNIKFMEEFERLRRLKNHKI